MINDHSCGGWQPKIGQWSSGRAGLGLRFRQNAPARIASRVIERMPSLPKHDESFTHGPIRSNPTWQPRTWWPPTPWCADAIDHGGDRSWSPAADDADDQSDGDESQEDLNRVADMIEFRRLQKIIQDASNAVS